MAFKLQSKTSMSILFPISLFLVLYMQISLKNYFYVCFSITICPPYQSPLDDVTPWIMQPLIFPIQTNPFSI